MDLPGGKPKDLAVGAPVSPHVGTNPLPDAFAFFREEGHVMGLSRAFYELCGNENIDAAWIYNLFDDPLIPEQDKKDIRAGKTIGYDINLEAETYPGQILLSKFMPRRGNLHCLISPTRDAAGKIAGHVLSISNDNLSHEAAASGIVWQNAERDKFLSIISHDLKNPFNAISGFADLLLQNIDETNREELVKGLEIIKSASDQAFHLLENLLTWANNRTGKTPFHPEPLNIREQIYESMSGLENQANRKSITLSIRANKFLNVLADRAMLDNILRNLISNAIKYSYKNSTIRIETKLKDEKLLISVSDRGIGISPKRIQGLFDIRNRTITPGTEAETGTGLGLIVCKDFIDRHQEKIWVESVPDQGTKITFSLPLV